ncbi:MAG TPA: hypothetical protein VFR41_09550 [Acidimicrobiia bacterium]|nr:hypothetical protein [Acidimicrobiia bacterium]
MNTTIHFDPRMVRPMAGGVVVSFDSTKIPERAEVIETATFVTITLFDDRPTKKHRFSRFARHEVFVPLAGPLSCRTVIDGANTPEPNYAIAS